MMRALIALLLLIPIPSKATTYLLTVAPFATGLIETDGTIGQLASSNIVNWDISYPNLNGITDELTPANSMVRIYNFGTTPGVFTTQASLGLSVDPSVGIMKFTNTTLVPNGPAGEICFCAPLYLSQHAFQYGSDFVWYFNSINQDPQIAVDPPAVPEPSTWALMLVGFAGIFAAYKRRLA